MLLDSLGDSEIEVPDGGSSELLVRLLHSGSQFIRMEPTDTDSIPKLDVDQWSSSEEIELERSTLESKLAENRRNLDAQFGGVVDDNLAAHASFTLSLLERLCNAINEGSGANAFASADQLNAVAQLKEYHAEKLMLNDRITKLTAEIVGLNAKLKICENEKLRTARKLDKAVLAAKELEQQKAVAGAALGGATAAESGVLQDSTNTGANATENAVAQNSAVEKELRRQIVVLERQLTESETAKSKVEMTLTERLARPLSQTEAQVADMRRSMEELRAQCKQRVSSLVSEVRLFPSIVSHVCVSHVHSSQGEALQEKVRNLEIALHQVETVSAARMADLATICERDVAAAKAQTNTLQTQLCSMQADLAVTAQLKTQLVEYQAMEGLCSGEVRKLQNELKMLTETQAVLRDNLEKSRAREAALQSQVQTQQQGQTQDATAAAGGATATTAAAANPLLEDLQRELEDARSNINDLILEIDGVAAEELKARTQSGRLLRQIAEYQGMQRVALEENLRLQNQIEDIRVKHAEAESKCV